MMTAKRAEILASLPSRLDFPQTKVRLRVRRLLIEAKNEGLIDGRRIETVEALCRLTPEELERNLYGMGFKSVELIKEALAKVGLRFEMTDADFEAYRIKE